ncbi:hypothetical protein L596_003479 [Steinernema carpocapsae]|uniref:HDAg domain-containing protein n=1 Tax=Steinernema carpocapsae TaxID=34508 RepID=A0A4U8UUB6_STECR|nr:hypothetical protein L596_003479 [Steinernema carpocapsae]
MPSIGGSQLFDQDLVKWIEAKLGDPSELWSGSLASSLLSREMLTELETCYQELDNHVKLKIILAISHLSHRLLQQFRQPLERLLTLARRDVDEWVEAIASMHQTVFENGSISFPESERDLFNKAIAQFEKVVKHGGCAVSESLQQLPQETAYMTHFAIRTTYGCPERPLEEHFKLKHKPKSALLLEEVTKAFNNIGDIGGKGKCNGMSSTFPLRMRSTVRKPNNNLPMKGIPTVSACKQSAGFTNEPRKFTRPLIKREGGAKLLQLDEIPQPIMKKRRRATEAEEKKPKTSTTKKRRESESLSSPTGVTVSSPSSSHATAETSAHDSATGNDKTPTPSATSPLASPTPSTADASERRNTGRQQAQKQKPEQVNQNSAQDADTIIPTVDPVVQYCEDLYRTSNRLDQNGYFAILSFMRGNRVPHPSVPTIEHIGSIKLTESREACKQPDGSTKYMLVETIFEVNRVLRV